jgi:hypothetical protein
MKLSRFSIGLIGSFFLLAGAPVVLAADAPRGGAPDKPAVGVAPVKPKGPAVTLAIAALQKEFQAYVKNPQANKLREKSDYFVQNPSPDVTPEAILKALESNISGGYPVESYVKWQLLSGITDKFSDDLVKRAAAVYRRAPEPANHPGLDHRGMNKVIMGVKKERIGEIQKEFDAAVGDNGKLNHVVLSYRDKLYSLLPTTYEVLSLGLADAAERATCGLNANGIFDTVAMGIRSWSITQAKTGQVKGMADAVAQLKNVVGKDANKPYNKLVDENGVKWKAEGATIDGKKLDELIKFLDANVTASGSGGLKFKDEKK